MEDTAPRVSEYGYGDVTLHNTVIFPQLKAMRKLLIDYSSLWLIPAASTLTQS